MTVEELIKQLQTLDPLTEVLVYPYSDNIPASLSDMDYNVARHTVTLVAR